MVAFNPEISYFKPRGIPMHSLSEVRLTVDEREAIRLADLHGMSHEQAGRHMHISRATFGRIIQQARKIVADALINGKAINIEGGNYKVADQAQTLTCGRCSHQWVEARGKEPEVCPKCNRETG
jgi:predicted DNA-binding protein (UPF0251 family)